MTAVLERPTAVLVAVSRPWFWPVSWVPAYLGTVLAGRAPFDRRAPLLAGGTSTGCITVLARATT